MVLKDESVFSFEISIKGRHK